ncbi:glycosyltransferase family 2 protein [Naasia lichenicola]|uniref:Glycosyltransferase family 2 protein n=1 Tax=Naasia lichenicola TaxID=2565933 RepID=A0A4S4FJ83_9MICO|nr:galactosyltransferase-related protein [Naasia lichenicola]THG29912.1 glycosyltransferase family 2 protein [Naasia lichenicola]
MKTSVITIVSGRRRHLERQHDALLAGPVTPDEHVVVAMDEPGLEGWRSESALPPLILPMERVDGRLPLASARNAGAARAIAHGAELLVFLDVDCIPGPGLLSRYQAAATVLPRSLLSGAVGYLGPDEHDPETFASARFPSFRPMPAPGELLDADPLLFWSLSFAVTVDTWREIDGFDPGYTGYGAEDTDFAQSAVVAGVPHTWVGGAEAFHQHHESQHPPVDHLDDILRNGARFADRWGFWPMRGWLDEFENQGLIERISTGEHTPPRYLRRDQP